MTTTSEGQITSPNFPNDYPVDSQFFYYVSTPGIYTRLYISVNVLGIGGTLSSAYVAIYTDDTLSTPIMAPYCGGPFATVAMANKQFVVKFLTDPTISGQGFEIFYREFETKDNSITYYTGTHVTDSGWCFFKDHLVIYTNLNFKY